MIHVGRFRAIIALIAIIGGIIIWMSLDIIAGFGFMIFMSIVGIAARILSTIMLAVTGKPLLYDVKTIVSNDGDEKSY